jgi:ribosomal protein S18 acetylase RimI-like enzyme
MAHPLVLAPLTDPELAEYLASAVPDYAREAARSEDLAPDEAQRTAVAAYARLLPDGLRTENQFLFSVREVASGNRVGLLWFARKTQGARTWLWIYDIIVDPAFRGRGYGERVLGLAEEEARARGASSVELHVFGHNAVARRLYERTGYQVTNLTMRKLVT